MSENISTALIAAVAGLLSGAIGSLLAPWAQWGVERRRTQLEARRARIVEWRKAVEERPFDADAFRMTNSYASIRPYLPKDLVSRVETDEDVVVREGDGRYSGVRASAAELLDEISRLEREWRLI